MLKDRQLDGRAGWGREDERLLTHILFSNTCDVEFRVNILNYSDYSSVSWRSIKHINVVVTT